MNKFIEKHPWLFTIFVVTPIVYVPALAVGLVVGVVKKAKS